MLAEGACDAHVVAFYLACAPAPEEQWPSSHLQTKLVACRQTCAALPDNHHGYAVSGKACVLHVSFPLGLDYCEYQLWSCDAFVVSQRTVTTHLNRFCDTPHTSQRDRGIVARGLRDVGFSECKRTHRGERPAKFNYVSVSRRAVKTSAHMIPWCCASSKLFWRKRPRRCSTSSVEAQIAPP